MAQQPPPQKPEMAPTLELKEGDMVGSYIVQRKLGQGGMGAVYLARHKELNRAAAIKFMTGPQHRELVARFLNEAKIANQVPHPGIVQVYETGRLPSGEAFMVMELIAGETLSARITAAAKSPARFLGRDGIKYLRQIAGVMSVAHAHYVIHRDLKPSNIMLVPDPEARDGERVKILDFGIAKLVAPPDTPVLLSLEHIHTRTGAQVGTELYMSPEQWVGSKSLDDRVDVYALGVIAYLVLASELPFKHESNQELMHRFEEPRPLRSFNPDLPEPLYALVARMLAKQPSERPAMAEVRDELSKMLGLAPGGGSTQQLSAVLAPTGGDKDTLSQGPTADAVNAPSSQRPTVDREPSGVRAGQQVTNHDGKAAQKRTGVKVAAGLGAVAVLALGSFALRSVTGSKPASTPPASAAPAVASTSPPLPPPAPSQPPDPGASPAERNPAISSAGETAKQGPAGKRPKKKNHAGILLHD